MLERVLKIQLFTFVGLLVLYRRIHVIALIWVLALSIGYYGVKGGLFTLLTGGSLRVWGPADSFIMDNNALAVAVTITIPLWVYLFIVHRAKVVANCNRGCCAAFRGRRVGQPIARRTAGARSRLRFTLAAVTREKGRRRLS